MRNIKLLLLLLLVVVPATALAIYKPVRVLLPEAFGVNCDKNICVDDYSKRGTAIALFTAAKEILEHSRG